jgi:hypothetical protein
MAYKILNPQLKVMKEDDFRIRMKKRFSYLSDQELVDKINQKFKNNENDDDEVYELFQRKKEKGLKINVGYDTYELIK